MPHRGASRHADVGGHEHSRLVETDIRVALPKLYLDGKIEQFWFRDDKPGVVFLMNVDSVEQAKATVNALPLAAGGFLAFETIPVGPLKPLGLLIQGQ
jgi:hypothetical protein